MSNIQSFRRELANGHFEQAEDGALFLPKSKVFLSGAYEHEVIRDGKSLGKMLDHNLVVNEGLNYLLSVSLDAGSANASWYIGIFAANYTPVATDTGATISGNSTESTAYDETARQGATFASPNNQSITNSATKATFSINATKTIYGAFLISNSTKGGTTGTLMSASAFSASRNVLAGDSLAIAYTLSAADA